MTQQDLQATAAKDKQTMWMALGLVWELGYLIALPAFLFGFGGAYLDKYFGTSPIFVLTGLLIALAISSFIVYKRVKAISSRF
jgi:F0F1-type ATP synthase assembly protein I